MFIPIIVSATRPGAQGMNVGKALHKLLVDQFPEVETKLVSPNDFPLEFDSNVHHHPDYTELTKKADGFIFVISEYNHSFPGRFKTLLDSEFKNYHRKFALLAGVSDGVFGGARALESILPVMRSLDIRTIRKDIPFIKAQELVNENGEFINEEQKQRSLDSLNLFIDILKN